ncbi:hypothetical protein QRX50_12545 [Amycolatopsis carbonis]|uniref:Uncharacterized protein n=1 Tax=Amycolatopsis carbonis TaxID=715471 RepID=A0A9Y2INE5_9PSEU|nr:hypothetical protein [Amycolatopsis sp. 2-15]WIX81523.1 hypothetical protein QRX50_12545 [Amycolatopsis sp. 2-15]
MLTPAAGAVTAPAGPIELAPRAGDTYTGLEAINDRGTVVGESYPRDVRILYRPMKWSATGEPTALPTLGGAPGQAVAIDEADVVAGWAEDAQGVQRAARWAADGTVARLPDPGKSSSASAISDTGRIVGASYDGTASHALLWERDGRVRELPGLSGGGSAFASEITPDGRIVAGIAADAAGHTHLVRWDERGRITDLTPDGEYGTVAGISRSGAIIGSSTLAGGNTVAKRWDPSGHVVTLGGTAAPSFGATMGISDNGTVVGLVDPDFGAATRHGGIARAGRRTCRAAPATRRPTPSTAPARSPARPRASARNGRRTASARGWNRCRATTSASTLLINSRGLTAGMSYGDFWRGVIWR